MNYGSGTFNLLGVLGVPVTATVTAGSTTTFNLIGVLDTFTISSSVGSNVTVNNTLGVGDNLVLNTNGGALTLNSSVLTADALGSVKVDVDDGGTFTLGTGLVNANVIESLNVQFGAGGGTYDVGTGSAIDLLTTNAPFTGPLTTSDIIDDPSLGTPVSYTITGGPTQTITLTDGSGHTFTFDISGEGFTDGSYTPADGPLGLTPAAGGGTDITVCFLAGTRVGTPDGEAAIESLKIGDPVLTADGRTLPIRWIGVDTVSTVFADALRVMPIRIRAGSLGENLPVRDLLVSPDHAMFIDGVLAQAGALVNGVSITREAEMPETFKYYHLELAEHCLILAEGAATETFVDNVDRMSFDNWAEHRALFGDINAIVEMDYPRAKSARQVPGAVKATIATRQAHFRSELATAA